MKKMNLIIGWFLLLLTVIVLSGCTTPMYKAVKKGDVNTVERLLGEGANINDSIESGMSNSYYSDHTLLTYYSRWGNLKMVEWLIAKGADINIAVPSVGGTVMWQKYTPLMWTCLYGHTEVAKMLLAAGADTESRGRVLIQSII